VAHATPECHRERVREKISCIGESHLRDWLPQGFNGLAFEMTDRMPRTVSTVTLLSVDLLCQDQEARGQRRKASQKLVNL
jgi:hypothetical protein